MLVLLTANSRYTSDMYFPTFVQHELAENAYSITSSLKYIHFEKDICFFLITLKNINEICCITYHMIALAEAILSVKVW